MIKITKAQREMQWERRGDLHAYLATSLRDESHLGLIIESTEEAQP